MITAVSWSQRSSASERPWNHGRRYKLSSQAALQPTRERRDAGVSFTSFAVVKDFLETKFLTATGAIFHQTGPAFHRGNPLVAWCTQVVKRYIIRSTFNFGTYELVPLSDWGALKRAVSASFCTCCLSSVVFANLASRRGHRLLELSHLGCSGIRPRACRRGFRRPLVCRRLGARSPRRARSFPLSSKLFKAEVIRATENDGLRKN